MSTDIIREYLIKLGVDISAAQIKKMEDGLNKIDKQITTFFKIWTHSTIIFLKSYGKISKSILDLNLKISKADMGMQRWAKTMYLTTDSAKALDRTLSAMDLSLEDLRDVALNPELTRQYKELLRLSHSLTVGEDFNRAAKGFREISFEFQKMKVLWEYFKEKIVAYTWKILQSTPARNFVEALRRFNTNGIKVMDKIARTLGTIAGYFLSAAYQFVSLINPVIDFFNWLPDKIKAIGVAASVVIAGMMAGPIGKALLVFQVAGALLEDYHVFMAGGLSWEPLKPVWEFINDLPNKIQVLKEKLLDLFDFIRQKLAEILHPILKNPLIKKVIGEVDIDGILGRDIYYNPRITGPELTKEQLSMVKLLPPDFDETAQENARKEYMNQNNITINVNGAKDPKDVADETVALIRRHTGVYA